MKLKKRTKINKQLEKLTALAVMVDYDFYDNNKTVTEILKIRDKISKITME
tara:strand:+ start:100 stop:252 length:153 start_codon:yes stop_codon:yes gene_type:complete